MSSLTRQFFSHARNMPAKMAIYCDNQTISYQQLATLVNHWSSALQAKGIQRGDHMAVLLPNSIEYVALMLVAAKLGLVLVPLNIALPPVAIQRACQATDVKHIVATTDSLVSLKPLLTLEGLWIAADENSEDILSLPDLTQTPYTDFVAEGQDDDVYILTMTSGSTGNPKPIMLRQLTKLNRAHAAIALYKVSQQENTLIATPLYHSLAERLALIALLTGGTLIIMSRFSAAEWLRTVSEQAVSFTIGVSSQLRQIAQCLDQKPQPFSLNSLRCLVSSSALLEIPTKEKLLANLTCEFHECYGTSEIAIATNLNAEQARLKLHSVGQALPNVIIKILRDDNTEAMPNEVGEIVCKTPMLFGGYYKLPERTQAAMVGEYFRTGDIGKLDEEGFLYFLGRKKEIIITGGINVYPTDIESILSECHTVKESAAFPFPDERLGEIIAVALVPHACEPFNLRSIRFHCATRLADYQQPRKFFIVEALPKNSLGKVMKHAILAGITTES